MEIKIEEWGNGVTVYHPAINDQKWYVWHDRETNKTKVQAGAKKTGLDIQIEINGFVPLDESIVKPIYVRMSKVVENWDKLLT